jgi:hypothetical protein
MCCLHPKCPFHLKWLLSKQANWDHNLVVKANSLNETKPLCEQHSFFLPSSTEARVTLACTIQILYCKPTLGLRGGGIFLLAKADQSNPINHGCCLMSSTPARSIPSLRRGLRSRRRVIKSCKRANMVSDKPQTSSRARCQKGDLHAENGCVWSSSALNNWMQCCIWKQRHHQEHTWASSLMYRGKRSGHCSSTVRRITCVSAGGDIRADARLHCQITAGIGLSTTTNNCLSHDFSLPLIGRNPSRPMDMWWQTLVTWTAAQMHTVTEAHSSQNEWKQGKSSRPLGLRSLGWWKGFGPWGARTESRPEPTNPRSCCTHAHKCSPEKLCWFV